jgi:hypothetical protein
MREVCMSAIKGVGDKTRGSIPDERGPLSYQVRRRLSLAEEAMGPGGACDIRQTAEALERFGKAQRWLPEYLHAFALDEISGGAA